MKIKIELAKKQIMDFRASEIARVGFYNTPDYYNKLEEIKYRFKDVEIYSPTGVCRGAGSDKYKSVVFLTEIERDAVFVGCTVCVDSNTDYQGITSKRVNYSNGYYNHMQLKSNVDTEKMLRI